jgi:nitronate monooxygenase
MLVEAGVDAIVAQGAEAGAHRGTFAGPFEGAMVPTMDLVLQISRLTALPVIASGGLMDGHDIAAAMDRGASAAQLGTAFLTCPESGASSMHKEAVLAAKRDTTSITRAFSGRPARALTNTFLSKLAMQPEIILPFPLQNRMTRPMRMAAAKLGNAGFLSLWAGQGVTRARSMSAATLVQCLVEEINAVSGTPRG